MSLPDSACFVEFLSGFVADHNGPIGPDDALPVRILTYYVSLSEVEAETLEWARQYLLASGAPERLQCLLARAATDAILKTDLSSLVEPQTPKISDNDDDDNDETDGSEPSSPGGGQIEAARLARLLVSAVHRIAAEWSGKNNTLSENSPLSSPAAENDTQTLSVTDVSAHAIKNTRRRMEDRHVALVDLGWLFPPRDPAVTPPTAYFAVFDGHGGLDAAIYASTHLHANLARNQHYAHDLPLALRESILQTDADFLVKASREGLRSGTTAVVAAVRGKQLTIAWVGDSQAMLCRSGAAVCLMEPHKPSREDEQRRIADLGGCVMLIQGAHRVNGCLSVSRALGDLAYRPYVSCDPDVATFNLSGDEDFLVVGCDGLWDVVGHDTVVREIHTHLSAGGDRSGAARRLVALAKERRSGDNISVIVVFLREELSQPRAGDGGEGDQQQQD